MTEEERDKRIEELVKNNAAVFGVTEDYLKSVIRSAIDGIEMDLLKGKGNGKPIGLLRR